MSSLTSRPKAYLLLVYYSAIISLFFFITSAVIFGVVMLIIHYSDQAGIFIAVMSVGSMAAVVVHDKQPYYNKEGYHE